MIAALCLSVSATLGCASDARVSVDLFTDLVAGEEFDAVEIRLAGRVHSFAVVPGQSFLPDARRLGPVRAASGTAVRIEVALVLDGADVLSTSQAIVAREETVVPIYLLRSCLDITCPDASDPLATECRDGACVRPDCDGDAGVTPGCPPPGGCAVDLDCEAPPADCARARCLEAHCVVVPSTSACVGDTYCDPDRGCVPRTMPLPAAGVPDAGPPPECTGRAECPSDAASGWSACEFSAPCAESAPPQTRIVTLWSCESSRCVSRDEVESSPCSRSTSAMACGTSTTGPWSACTYDMACPRTGRRRADVVSDVCRSGACTTETTSIEDTMCPRIVETCNRIDDDCSGSIDDGFQVHVFDSVPTAELSALQPGCTGFGGGLDLCLTASLRWCGSHAWACFNGAAGILDGGARVACLGTATVQRVLTYDDVITASGITFGPVDIGRRIVSSAANRYCQMNGFAGGIGPIEHSYPTFVLACVPAPIAEMVSVDPSEMQTRGCDPTVDADTAACTSAADGVCRARGFEAGWGPLEWNATVTFVLCLRG